MPVSLEKTPTALEYTVDATDPESPYYVTVVQDPDGHVSAVRVTDTPPSNEETFRRHPHATVWATPLPEYEDEPADAIKVLDLALSAHYRDESRGDWSYGQRIATDFRKNRTNERRTLRAIEAHLIRKGFTNVHTGAVSVHGYGLTLDTPDEHSAFVDSDGWRIATADFHSVDGWYVVPSPIAPLRASTRHVAAALLACLVESGDITMAELSPLTRLHVRYRAWRMKPNWRNFKYRTQQRVDRYRRRYRRWISARTR